MNDVNLISLIHNISVPNWADILTASSSAVMAILTLLIAVFAYKEINNWKMKKEYEIKEDLLLDVTLILNRLKKEIIFYKKMLKEQNEDVVIFFESFKNLIYYLEKNHIDGKLTTINAKYNFRLNKNIPNIEFIDKKFIQDLVFLSFSKEFNPKFSSALSKESYEIIEESITTDFTAEKINNYLLLIDEAIDFCKDELSFKNNKS